jgi:hypothetical protein
MIGSGTEPVFGCHPGFGHRVPIPRKVRDPTLPLIKRVGALRSAVVLYQPLGWKLTLSFLDQAVGGLRPKRAGCACGVQVRRLGCDQAQRRFAASCGVAVFVDESAEHVGAFDMAKPRDRRQWRLRRGNGTSRLTARCGRARL